MSLHSSYHNYKGEQIISYVENFVLVAFTKVSALNIDSVSLNHAINLNPYTNFHQVLQHILAQRKHGFLKDKTNQQSPLF